MDRQNSTNKPAPSNGANQTGNVSKVSGLQTSTASGTNSKSNNVVPCTTTSSTSSDEYFLELERQEREEDAKLDARITEMEKKVKQLAEERDEFRRQAQGGGRK